MQICSWRAASASSVESGAEYAGRTAAGRFVEVTILARNAKPTSAASEVSTGQMALRLADGREVRPVGAVIAGAGAKALAAGDVRIPTAAPGAAGAARTYVPLVVAFDVPADARRATVRLGAGPEFALDIANK